MSKYIIEIAKEYEEYFKGVLICGIADGKFAVDVIAREDLEELNSDYINEHYGELQDEAYQRGYEAGKESTKNGCMGCKYETRTSCEEPCKYCPNCHTSKYTPMPENKDRIEVGDEVKAAFGTAVVTYLEEDSVGYLYSTGTTGFDIPRNLIKTGKHYDIASILEAMRT